MSPQMDSKPLRLSLGPFQGITDVYYRNLFKRYFSGIDKFYTPFFTGVYKAGGRRMGSVEIDPGLNDVNSLTPQILSRDADEIILFGNECQKLGYKEVNWNLGCPYPRVANKKRGSGLLPHPEMVVDIMDKLKNSLPLPLSVKCRLGYSGLHEIDALIPSFNQYPLSELIVHARLGKQLYKGRVYPDQFARLAPQVKTCLVYNGDVFSNQILNEFRMLFPDIRYWMLGRGLLADPFLALDIKGHDGPVMKDRKDIVYHFMTDLYLQRLKNSNNRPGSLGKMKELWSYLAWSFSDPATAWRLIRKASGFESYESAVSKVFSSMEWLGRGFSAKIH